jgi:type I restriction enzyme S subunit
MEDGRTLHQGWSPQCDKIPSPSEDVWGVLKTTSIQTGEFQPEHNKLLPPGLEPRPMIEVKEGDILLTCAGPRVRCGVPCLVRQTRKRLMMSGKMYRFRVNPEEHDARYIEAFLQTERARQAIDKMKTGSSDSGLNLTHERFRQLPVPVPATVHEQRRIVAEIEKQFTRLEAGVAALRRVQANLKRYRAAVLKAACEGDLSEDWRKMNEDKLPSAQTNLASIGLRREETFQKKMRAWEQSVATKKTSGKSPTKPRKPENIIALESAHLPKGWLTFKIASLCEIEDGDRGSAYPKKDDFSDSGYCLFLNTKNVRPDGFDFTVNQFITREKHEALRKGTLKRGDVVFTSRGTLGNIAHYSQGVSYDVMRINSGMFILRHFDHAMSQQFLAHLLRSPQIKAQIADLQSGSAQPQLPIGDFREFTAAVPPLEEQEHIVAEVERRLSVVEELEAVVTTNLQRATRLRQAVLQKAFSGNL